MDSETAIRDALDAVDAPLKSGTTTLNLVGRIKALGASRQFWKERALKAERLLTTYT